MGFESLLNSKIFLNLFGKSDSNDISELNYYFGSRNIILFYHNKYIDKYNRKIFKLYNINLNKNKFLLYMEMYDYEKTSMSIEGVLNEKNSLVIFENELIYCCCYDINYYNILKI